MDQVVKKKQEQLLQCLKKISSKQSANEDDQRQQLRKFQSEVEQKFKAAHHNHHYRFPLEFHDNSNDSSLDELRKPGPYDLKSQNKKPEKAKSLIKIMSDERVRQRYKTEQYDENRFPNKSIEKQTNEQIISFLRKSVAKRSQYSQHTQRSNNQSHIMSQSFNCKTRTQNYYLNKFTKMKLDMCKNQTSTSYQDSKISLKHFFSKSPEQTSTINLKNKLAEMCKRQPLKVL